MSGTRRMTLLVTIRAILGTGLVLSLRLTLVFAGGGRVDDEVGGLRSDVAHAGDDGAELAVVSDPFFVEVSFGGGEAPGDGLAVDLRGPLVVGAVRLGRVGVAAATGTRAACVAVRDAARGDEPDVADLIC